MTAPITIDRLDPGLEVEVRWLRDDRVGERPVREPHRHAYHELAWVRDGRGLHRLDGRPVPVRTGSVTIIGRGQVHVFEHAEGLHGAVVRFGDEVLLGDASARSGPGWLLAGRGGRTVAVPAREEDRLEAAIAALDAEARRPPDAYGAEARRHLVALILVWIERWYDAGRTEHRDADDVEVELQRRFTARLERDFPHHHDAAHYADALGVPQAALSRALTQATGRSTKELVMDRVMLEAMRLLRFTDLSVGEVAHRAGFGDALYFSRAFKRHTGQAPIAYRGRVRGRAA